MMDVGENTIIRAVRCHEFATVEEVADDGDGDKKETNATNRREKSKRKFRPRAQPLSMRRVLSLDEIPIEEIHPALSSRLSRRQQQQRPNQQRLVVVIRTCYVGVQYPDMLQARGLYQIKPRLPYIPCMDVTGIVIETIGDDSSNNNSSNSYTAFRPGDRVMATCTEQGGTGAMSEIVVCPAQRVFRIPDNVPLAAAANIGRNYFAAYHSVKTIGRVAANGPSSLVLVDGASGGVGMACIELAKAMGCTVIAGVSTPEKAVHPASVGADFVACYGRDKDGYRKFKNTVLQAAKDLGHPQGVDLVVDMVQGDLFDHALLSVVKPLGTSKFRTFVVFVCGFFLAS